MKKRVQKKLVSNFQLCHVKTGDLVKIIAGDFKGQEGIVLKVSTKFINGPKVKIKGINLIKKKNIKQQSQASKEKYIEVEDFIHASNIKLIKSKVEVKNEK